MSRTIRRKSAHHERARFVGRLEEVDRWDLERYGVTDPKKCLEKKAARFHGDHYWGGNAPSWFARQLDKKIARANAAELHRCLRQDCWEDHLPVRHLKNANWLWW